MECGQRETTRRRWRHDTGAISNGEGDEALNAGIELDHADASEMGVGGNPPQGQGQAVEWMRRVDDVDRVGCGIAPVKRGSLLGAF